MKLGIKQSVCGSKSYTSTGTVKYKHITQSVHQHLTNFATPDKNVMTKNADDLLFSAAHIQRSHIEFKSL